MEKLITSEHLSNIKFAADCAIKEPDSIYSQEFFMLLDETFGSKGDYESPTQAVAVAWLINRLNELKQRAEAAEARLVNQDYFGSLVSKARISADKAMVKFPQPNYVLLKVAEEAGEVVQAGVHYAENRMSWGEVEGEIVQLIAMLIRLVTEGDQVNGITPPESCRDFSPAPVADLAELVPLIRDLDAERENGYLERAIGWNDCRTEMLRNIEEAK